MADARLERRQGRIHVGAAVPRTQRFGAQYGFRFLCRGIGHANRKAGEERSFWTVEANFLPGRTFESLEDLNTQAFAWATERLTSRRVRGAPLVIKGDRGFVSGVLEDLAGRWGFRWLHSPGRTAT